MSDDYKYSDWDYEAPPKHVPEKPYVTALREQLAAEKARADLQEQVARDLSADIAEVTARLIAEKQRADRAEAELKQELSGKTSFVQYHAGLLDQAHRDLAAERVARERAERLVSQWGKNLEEVWLPADQTVQCAVCGWYDWSEQGPHQFASGKPCPVAERDAALARQKMLEEALEGAECLPVLYTAYFDGGHTPEYRKQLYDEMVAINDKIADASAMVARPKQEAFVRTLSPVQEGAAKDTSCLHYWATAEQCNVMRCEHCGARATEEKGEKP